MTTAALHGTSTLRFPDVERDGCALADRVTSAPFTAAYRMTARLGRAFELPTTASILAACRSRGVDAIAHVPSPDGEGAYVHDQKFLLASLGLDLMDVRVRRRLLVLNQAAEIALVSVDIPETARRSLAERGLDTSLVDRSELRDQGSAFHAVLVRGEP